MKRTKQSALSCEKQTWKIDPLLKNYEEMLHIVCSIIV
nr:MAG TPA: hypothetical protein [Caudoviricetes sp.]